MDVYKTQAVFNGKNISVAGYISSVYNLHCDGVVYKKLFTSLKDIALAMPYKSMCAGHLCVCMTQVVK